jgi:DNA-binding protein H-NS
MTNYIQLRNQIQRLEKEAEILRKRERSETIAKIKEAITAFELTAEDLGLSGAKRSRNVQKFGKKSEGKDAVATRGRGRPPKSAVTPNVGRRAGRKSGGSDKRSVVAPKYRDPATGTTWTGRGKQPKWLAAAIGSGKKLGDFKI